MFIKYLFLVLNLSFCIGVSSCAYEIETENLDIEPSVLAIMFADSIQQVYISHKYYDNNSENQWDIFFKSKFGKQKLNFKHDNTFFYDRRYQDIVYYFDKASNGNENTAVYALNNELKLDSGDTLELELNNKGVQVKAKTLISPQIEIKTAVISDDEIQIRAIFPSGRYVWDIQNDYLNNSFDFRYISVINLHESRDSTVIISKYDKNTVSFRIWDKTSKKSFVSSSYPEHFLAYILQRDHVSSYANSANLFEAFGDDISRFHSISANLKPFYGHFAVISRSRWEQK